MDLDNLLRIGVDAAAAFAVVNIVNAIRQGWIWPKLTVWLNKPQDKQGRQSRVIALAWWVSVVVAGVFALRVGYMDWKQFAGEWVSRAIICWLLAMGQFDAIKLAWPAAFNPHYNEQSEVIADEGLDP